MANYESHVVTCLWFIIFQTVLIDATSLPIVIAHRGASGYRPENTLMSYDKAIEMGADYIEGDLVPTKDHILVASHNPDISNTTDVGLRSEFNSRYCTKNVSGELITGYFITDFTLAELKSLRTKEGHSCRDQSWNYLFPMPTLEEILLFVKAKEIEKKRKIGIYLETKHSSYYRSLGLPTDELLVEALHAHGYKDENDSVFIQSFESNLLHLKQLTKIPLIQLIGPTMNDSKQWDTGRYWRDFVTEDGLQKVATYATGVGVHKTSIFVKENGFIQSTDVIKFAHNAGLLVHVWTFRKETDHFKDVDTRIFSTFEEEIAQFLIAGIDGTFADHPDVALRVRDHVFSTSFSWIFLVIGLVILIGALIAFFIVRLLRIGYNPKGINTHTHRSNIKTPFIQRRSSVK